MSNIEKKRNIINMLTSQSSGLKQEEDRLNLEINSKFLAVLLKIFFYLYYY